MQNMMKKVKIDDIIGAKKEGDKNANNKTSYRQSCGNAKV